MTTYRIKALEWKHDRGGNFHAMTPFGRYLFYPLAGSAAYKIEFVINNMMRDYMGSAPDPASAIQTCTEHWEAMMKRGLEEATNYAQSPTNLTK